MQDCGLAVLKIDLAVMFLNVTSKNILQKFYNRMNCFSKCSRICLPKPFCVAYSGNKFGTLNPIFLSSQLKLSTDRRSQQLINESVYDVYYRTESGQIRTFCRDTYETRPEYVSYAKNDFENKKGSCFGVLEQVTYFIELKRNNL